MQALIVKITEEVKPVYLSSKFYKHTIWSHAFRVAKYAKDFAAKANADQFAAEAAGLLHDLGAALYGREDHHITGAKEAVLVLLRCGCPLEFIGLITDSVYCHRGSQKFAFRSIEAKCVAAADALDHLTNLDELWLVQIRDKGMPESMVYRTISEKLKRDWEKISPEIKLLLDGTYERAMAKLLEISSRSMAVQNRVAR